MLALFAALIGPYFIDWSSYRAAFEKEASRALGQSVEVRGEADARLLPFPSLAFSDVVIGKDADGRPMMTVKKFSMDAELAPFLSGVIRIFDMRLDRPEARVRIEEDGTLDWALNHKPVPVGETVVLERVAITNAVIRIIDVKNGREHRLEKIDATLSARALSGPWIIEGEGTVGKQRGTFDIRTGETEAGTLRATARIKPNNALFSLELEGEAQIKDAKPSYDGKFTLRIPADGVATGRQDAVAPSAMARGNFALNNERLRIDEYRMEVGDASDPYVVTGEATIDTGAEPEFLLVADGQQVEFGTGGEDAGSKPGAQTPAPPVSASERLGQLNRLLARLPPPPLPGRVDIALPAILAGDTVIRDIVISARPEGQSWKIETFAASLPGRTKVEANGELLVGASPSFSGDMIVASSQPSGLANWLTGSVDPVIRQLDKAGFSARVDLTGELQRFNGLEVAIGSAILKGSLERQVSAGGMPSLSVDLSGNRFDIDAIRALANLAGVGEVTEPHKGDRPDLAGSGHLSARISADVLTIGEISIGGVDTSLLMRNGALELDRFSFTDLAGASGNVSGKLEGGLGAPVGAFSGKIKAASADALLALGAQLDKGNTIINRLRGNGGAFDELESKFQLNLKGEDGMSLSAIGSAGGTTFTVVADGPGLISQTGGKSSVKVEAENADFSRLAGQAGFAVLPFGENDAGSLDFRIDGDDTVKLTVTTGETVFSVNGNGHLPRDGQLTGLFDVTLQSPDIEPMLITFGQAVPQTGTGTSINLSSKLALTETEIGFSEIQGSAGDNTVSGQLAFSRKSRSPSASGQLALGNVDLAWLMEWVLGPQFQQNDGKTWSDAKFLPPFAGTPEFDVYLTADLIDLPRAGQARNFAGHAILKQGRFQLADAKAKWLGGIVSGSFNLDNSEGTVFLSGQLGLEHGDLPAIESAIAGTAPIDGKVSISTRIEGSGDSAHSLINALTGGGEIVIDDFRLSGFNPDTFDIVLQAADDEDFDLKTDTVAEIASKALDGGTISAQSVTLPFTITNGVQRFSPVSIETGGTTLTAEGRIDLTSFKVDSKFTLGFDPGDAALVGSAPELVIGVSGLLADPGKTLDVSALTNYLSIRAFERERRRVELLQAGVLEKQRLRRVLALVSENEEARAAALAAEELLRQQEEAARLAEELRLEQEAEAARQAEELRLKQEAEAARQAEELRLKQEAEAARQAEELRLKQEVEAARQAEELRLKQEAEAARQAEELRLKQEADAARSQKETSEIERAPLSPVETEPDIVPDEPALRPPPSTPILPGDTVPRLDFKGLPGVERF